MSLEERTLLSQAPGTWATVASLPNTPDGGYDAVSATTGLNGHIYAIGGGNWGEVDSYSPDSDAWTVIAPQPTGHYGGVAATGLNGLIYAIGGTNSQANPSSEVDAYNPSTNTWIAVASVPAGHYGGAAATGFTGLIYDIGGTNNEGNVSSEVDAYNPNTNTWNTVASLPTARTALTATAGPDGRIYAIGGYSSLPLTPTAEVDVYTPSTNSWSVIASLPTARGALASATGPDGLIYALGGRSGYGDSYYTSEVDTYTPSTNAWATVTSVPSIRASMGAAVGLDGLIYGIGGDVDTSNGRTGEVEAYVPVPPYIHKVTPITNWSSPSEIVYGTALELTQLDATASVPGNFTYAPTAGTVLQAGSDQVLSVTFTPADTSDYSSVLGITTTINVTPALLTISADNAMKVYGAASSALSANYSGFVNGDSQSKLTSLPALATTATANSHVAGDPYLITAGGAVDSDYSFTYVTGTVTVTPAPLTVTASDQAKAYGAALPTLTVNYSGFVNGDTSANFTTEPTLTTTAAASSHVFGNPYTISASGAADSDYSITYVPGTLTVTAAPLTITANNQTKAYGAALPLLTASYLGFANSDSSANFTAEPTLTSTAAASSHVFGNPYTITASGAVDSDYSITYVTGTLAVNAVPLLITAVDQTKAYGAALPTLTASYSGFVNDDTAANVTIEPTLATTAAASSHVLGDPYTITASGAADFDYSITYATGTLIVNAVSLMIRANDASRLYGAATTLSASYSGLVNGDTPSSLAVPPDLTTTVTTASHVRDSGYVIFASGASDPDYAITYESGTLLITPAALTIAANSTITEYGMGMPNLTASYFGLVNGDTPSSLAAQPTLSTSATAARGVGSYAISPNSAASDDYSISYLGGTLTITPAPLTITAGNASTTNGSALPPFSVSYSGFVNGDSPSILASSPTLSTSATSSSPAGEYPIAPSGATSPDYTIRYIDGVLIVAPAPVSVQSVSIQKIRLGKRKKKTLVIVLQFTGALNSGDSQSLNNYSLATTVTGKKHKSKVVGLSRATYDSINNTVTLVTRKPLVLKPPLKLTVDAAGLLDSLGRPLYCNGQPGGNFETTFS